ncbi:hypothetical protein, partial [Mycobacteroides abscessus]|uniref:hypothetical protein n=1 Tax=Mycobacteroides abscessus TaxID=36809 RepID=UPI001A98C347
APDSDFAISVLDDLNNISEPEICHWHANRSPGHAAVADLLPGRACASRTVEIANISVLANTDDTTPTPTEIPAAAKSSFRWRSLGLGPVA